MEHGLKIIARIRSGFPTKFGIPRQSGLVDAPATVVFEKAYRHPDALRGLEGFSHIWLIWGFSEAEREGWSATVRPPLLGGNQRVGVFATRSPYRPNAIALSSVRLVEIAQTAQYGQVLRVSGADLMDGTPIYDVKPYLAFTDSHPDAIGGFTEAVERSLQVIVPEAWRDMIAPDVYAPLVRVLQHDPRPSYQRDEARVYGMEYDGLEVKFTVQGGVLTVVKVEPL